MDEKQIKDCFNLFDLDGDGKITCTELGTVVRSLGQNPTDNDVRQIAENQIRSSSFTFDDLVRVMQKLHSGKSFTKDDIREAFKVFDRDSNGMVNAAELRHVMTNLGEKLTDEEVDEMIRAVEVEDGHVTYEDWVSQMAPSER